MGDKTARASVLGFDLSTQSLSLLVLSGATPLGETWEIEKEYTLNYDTDLPQYNTSGTYQRLSQYWICVGGVIRHSDGVTVTSPTTMWIHALDLLLHRVQEGLPSPNFSANSNEDGFLFSRVIALSVSGQQHGSVYWRNNSHKLLTTLNPDQTLVSQLASAFSVEQSPIWMDSSTHHICQEIEVSMRLLHYS